MQSNAHISRVGLIIIDQKTLPTALVFIWLWKAVRQTTEAYVSWWITRSINPSYYGVFLYIWLTFFPDSQKVVIAFVSDFCSWICVLQYMEQSFNIKFLFLVFYSKPKSSAASYYGFEGCIVKCSFYKYIQYRSFIMKGFFYVPYNLPFWNACCGLWVGFCG